MQLNQCLNKIDGIREMLPRCETEDATAVRVFIG